MARTKVFPNNQWKQELFTIYPVNKDGEKKNGDETKNVISIGIKKAKAVLAHVEELKALVEENDDD